MKYNVIIADDFEHDIELVALELKKTGRFKIIHKATDGGDVIRYLEGRFPFNDHDLFPLPHLLLLDLKMLKVDGFQVLRWIKTHAFPIVTFVVTGYEMENYIALARTLGAAAIFFKPLSKQDVTQMIALAERLIASLVAGSGG